LLHEERERQTIPRRSGRELPLKIFGAILVTSARPNIVIIEQQDIVTLIELTIPHNSLKLIVWLEPMKENRRKNCTNKL
jgi:hypothetical protein